MVCLSVVFYVTELHAYDFAVKDFVMKGGAICAGPCRMWRVCRGHLTPILHACTMDFMLECHFC